MEQNLTSNLTETQKNDKVIPYSLKYAREKRQKLFEVVVKKFLIKINDAIKNCCEKGGYELQIYNKTYHEWCLIDDINTLKMLEKLFENLGYKYDMAKIYHHTFTLQIKWNESHHDIAEKHDILMSANDAFEIANNKNELKFAKEIEKIDKTIRKKCQNGHFKCTIKFIRKNDDILNLLSNLGYDSKVSKKKPNGVKIYWYLGADIMDVHHFGTNKIISASQANDLSYENMDEENVIEYTKDFNMKIDFAIDNSLRDCTVISAKCGACIIAKKCAGDMKVENIDHDRKIKVSWE